MLDQSKNIYDANHINFKTVIIDQETRWNSTYNMLTRFVYLRTPVQQLTVTSSKLSNITDHEWSSATEIIRLLDLLFQYTLEFQSSKTVNIGSLHIAYRKLDFYLRVFQSSNNKIVESCNVMLQKLQKYYSKQDDFCLVTCILDPRVKMIPFTFIERDEIMYIFKFHLRKYTVKEMETEEVTITKDDRKGIIDDLHCEQKIHITDNDEVSRSLSLGLEGPGTDPLKWWKENKHSFRKLRLMAGDFFSTMPSSAALEMLFSKAGRTINNIRNKIDEDTAECTILLNCWMN